MIRQVKLLLFLPYYLPNGIVFKPDFSNIEVLQEDKKTGYESDGVLLDNLAKMNEASIDTKQAYKNLQDKYNG